MSAPKAIPQSSTSALRPPRQPLLWAALAYAAGIVGGAYTWHPPLWWAVAAVAFMAASGYFVGRRRWLAFPLALGTLFLVGALAIQMCDSRPPGDHPGIELTPDEEVRVTAHVIREGTLRTAGFGGVRQSVDVETEEITRQENTTAVRTGVRLAVYGKVSDEAEEDNQQTRVFNHGQRLSFTGKLHAPRNFGNPGAFDYKGYLAENKISLLGSAKSTKVEALLRFLNSADFDRTLEPRVAQMRLDLRMLAERTERFAGKRLAHALVGLCAHAGLSAYEVLCVAALMQSGLALPMAYYFYRATVMGVAANSLEVTAIDVGQGDSLLVVSPQGRTLLVDAGGPVGGQQSEFDFGENVVSPYLWERRISRLDAVAITHGHSDHVGGMHAVLNNFRPRELWVGALPSTPAIRDLVEFATRLGTKVIRRADGELFDFGGMQVSVYSPPESWQSSAQARNNDSLVLRLQYRESSALLEGDAESVVEPRMALSHDSRSDLLKVGHHGSATSSTPEFMNAVQPHWAIISAGSGNRFGHPRLETLERLQQAGVATYRTDLSGAVSFYLDGRSVTPHLACLR